MTRANGVEGHTIEEALEIFEETKNANGIACCLVSLAIERRPKDIRSYFDRAIALYEEAGSRIEANRARKMAEVFCLV